MSNKKKIVIVISIISIMILCFSISLFAIVYPYGIELHDGDVIVFKDVITDPLNRDIEETLNKDIVFKYNSVNVCTTMRFRYNGRNSNLSYIGNNNNQLAYWFYEPLNNQFGWVIPMYKTITIVGDQTLTDNDFINWLYENTVSGLPEPPTPPHIEPSFWETVSGFFSEALAYGTAIVNWMTITPIALIPLALYCLIVIIAITKRMIKG